MAMTEKPRRLPIAIGMLILVVGLSSVLFGVRNRAGNPSRQPIPQQLADKGEDTQWAQCESYCDPYKPGTSVAEVRWKVSDESLGITELKDRTAQEVLEVSVYKDGFERGLYANITPTEGRHGFLLANTQPTRRQLPGLNRLVMVGLNTSKSATKGFRMLATDPADAGEGQWAVAKVEGLEPGLLYFWRVQTRNASLAPAGARVVSCQAATCPVDSMRRPAVRRPR